MDDGGLGTHSSIRRLMPPRQLQVIHCTCKQAAMQKDTYMASRPENARYVMPPQGSALLGTASAAVIKCAAMYARLVQWCSRSLNMISNLSGVPKCRIVSKVGRKLAFAIFVEMVCLPLWRQRQASIGRNKWVDQATARPGVH